MDDRDKEINQIKALEWSGRDAFLELAAEEFAKYRKEFGHRVYVNTSVLVPVCQNYRYTYKYTYPEIIAKLSDSWTPDVHFSNYEMNLLLLGFHPAVVDRIKEDIEEGIEPERGPWCYYCECWVPYWRNENDACYVIQLPFREYFGFKEIDYPSVTRSMKERIIKMYRNRCFGCGAQLNDDDAMIDHITAKAKGGTGDQFNLQLLCRACNQEKNDYEAEVGNICLHFPMRPLPSDSYEGATW